MGVEKSIGRMATVPWRTDILPRVVQSLAGQLDELHIYTGDCEVPDEVRNLSSVRVTPGPNVGDRGRWTGGKDDDGYVLCLDDDILYPPDYVARMIATLNQYQCKAVMGVHARTFHRPKPQSYFGDSETWHFAAKLHAPQTVHLLGTGTLAYHTDLIRFDSDDFEYANVADLIVATSLERRGIPRIAIARQANWLRQLPVKESIYGKRGRYAALQNQLSNSIVWSFPPLAAALSPRVNL